MPAPLVTPSWRIQFSKQSVTDQDVYTFTETITALSAADVEKVIAALKKQGYVNVQSTLIITF